MTVRTMFTTIATFDAIDAIDGGVATTSVIIGQGGATD